MIYSHVTASNMDAFLFFTIEVYLCLLGLFLFFFFLRFVIVSMELWYNKKLDGWQFEMYISNKLNDMHCYNIRTKGSHDHGADLLLHNAIVQIKRYKGAVHNSVISEMLNAKKHYKKKKAILITTSRLSKPTMEIARKKGIVVIDETRIKELLVFKNWKTLMPGVEVKKIGNIN